MNSILKMLLQKPQKREQFAQWEVMSSYEEVVGTELKSAHPNSCPDVEASVISHGLRQFQPHTPRI